MASDPHSPADLSGLDVILPLGKPGAPAGHGAVEMNRFNGRTLIEWAVEEACHAGAARILAVAPAGWAETEPLLDHLHRTVLARGGLPLEVLRPGIHSPEGWDGLIRSALGWARGGQALVLDPVTLLTAGDRITTFAGFMLRRAAQDHAPGEGARPLLVTAELPWEEALSLPVLVEAPGSSRPVLSLDRPAARATLTVFAGRALVPLPLPEAPLPDAPSALFPGEALAATLLAAGARCLPLPFHPLDLRFSPLADVPLAPDPKGLPFSARLGLGTLKHIA